MSSRIKTFKLPEATARALSRAAKARGCSESELIREGIDWVTDADAGLDMATLIGPDVGIARGPVDLSSNPKWRVGYGRTRHR